MTAAVGGYVVYDNYNEADRATGGGVVKQDVAVNDKNGDLVMKMRGLGKEAATANEPGKSDTKPDNGKDVAEKLKEATKDADIKAETAKTAEQTPTSPELPPEKPYIPETAAAAEETPTSVKTAKTETKAEAVKTGDDKGSDGSNTETDNKISSDNKNDSDSKDKTGNTANNSNSETRPVDNNRYASKRGGYRYHGRRGNPRGNPESVQLFRQYGKEISLQKRSLFEQGTGRRAKTTFERKAQRSFAGFKKCLQKGSRLRG